MTRTYSIERDEDTKCFQQKYVYPGVEKWDQMQKEITAFIKTRKYMFNGGWAIHHFLKSLNKGLIIYDENDICDTTDFDMFGPSPAEDLIKLGEHLKAKIPEMTFTVNNGMHPNQYVVLVNFMGLKLVDWIYISPKVYKFVPSITYKDGVTCLHPRVELLRQYNMLSNLYLIAPDKDFNKALKRISLLEQYAFEPWIKEANLWDARKNNTTYKNFVEYPLNKNIKADKTQCIQLQSQLNKEWFSQQKYVAKLGQAAFLELVGSKKPVSYIGLEYVVHDAVFQKCTVNLIQYLKNICKAQNINQERIDLVQYEPFIAVIGPMYNGWLDVKIDDVVLCRLYSLATPVHMYDMSSKTSSYFFNMAHMMWRSLYLNYMRQSQEYTFYDAMVSTLYKSYTRTPKAKQFVLNMNKESTLGVIPVRNFYMVSNLLRFQKIGFFRQVIDNKVGEVQKKKIDTNPEYYYKSYEGKIVSRTYLSRCHKKLPDLPYLYQRMVSAKE